MAGEAALASAVTAAGAAVALVAWRIRAALTAVLALLASVGAAATFLLAVATDRQVEGPLVICAGLVLIATGLLAIGHLFNRLLGAEPE